MTRTDIMIQTQDDWHAFHRSRAIALPVQRTMFALAALFIAGAAVIAVIALALGRPL